MKKILFLSMCMLCMLVSCSSDDDDDKNVLNNSNIVGHWKMAYVQVYEKDTEELLYEGDEFDKIEIKFYEDGTCWYSYRHFPDEIYITVKEFYGTYKLLGNELDIYNDSKDYRWVIEEFDSGKMKISQDSWYHYYSDSYMSGKPIYTMERVN